MSVLPITIGNEAFLCLPYRVRKACGEGVLVRHKVGTNDFLIPAAIDIERWRPSWMSALLAKLLPRCPGAFLDVGVNRLQTFFDLRSLDTDRTYVGFEPNPACSTYAWQVFRLNPSSPNLILSCALSDASGVLDLWMTRNSEMVLCEVLHRDKHAAAEPHRRHLSELCDLLRHVGYSIYQIVAVNGDKTGRTVRPIEAFDDLVWTEQNAADCGYVFCPSERTELLADLV